MVKAVYDFREGLEKDKIVYKNDKWDWKGCFYYLLYLFATWGWAVAWFAVFQTAYIFNEKTAFWIYIGLWFAFIITIITIYMVNLIRFYKKKSDKKKRLEEEVERKRLAEEEERKQRYRGANDDIQTHPVQTSKVDDKVPLSNRL